MSEDSANSEELSRAADEIRAVIHSTTAATDSVQQVLQMPATIRALRELLEILPRFKGLDFSGDVNWYLHGLIRAIQRSYRQSVTKPRPCDSCGQPVATLRVFDAEKSFVVDAFENPDPNVPAEFHWSADIFKTHVCPADDVEEGQ